MCFTASMAASDLRAEGCAGAGVQAGEYRRRIAAVNGRRRDRRSGICRSRRGLGPAPSTLAVQSVDIIATAALAIDAAGLVVLMASRFPSRHFYDGRLSGLLFEGRAPLSHRRTALSDNRSRQPRFAARKAEPRLFPLALPWRRARRRPDAERRQGRAPFRHPTAYP
jgi:hypothetical protein